MTHPDEPRVAKPRRAAPADAVRPTRAEINLGALRHNLRVVARAVTPEGEGEAPRVWAVLKADAYGHGAPAVARTLERAGADGLCVALLEEGIELREAGVELPILVMGGYYGLYHRGLEDALEHDLTPVLYHPEQVERLALLARERGGEAPHFHLKFDTGMARLGAPVSAAAELFEQVAHTREIALTGLMSHFACADGKEREPTRKQLARFAEVRRLAASYGLSPRFAHASNSAALLRFSDARLGAVRPGLALYGMSPFFGQPQGAFGETVQREIGELRPVMRVRSEIVALRDLAMGDRVGYGHTFTADRERRIATVPMGYADGLSRALSNRGHVVIRGKRAPIVGIVSMDLTTVDVTEIEGAVLGDEVVFLGAQEGPLGAAQISAEEIAEIVGTIPWEVVTSISRRVPRFYREP